MKLWILLLRAFGYVWLTLATLLILAGVVGVWMDRGFSGVQEVFNPFNVINVVAVVLTLGPGIGALAWSDKLKARQALQATQG